MRNRSQKNAKTLLLEPTKNKEKKLLRARQTFAQRKTWKPASHQGKTHEKRAWDAHAKKQNPSKFCAQTIAKLQLEKSRNVAFGTH